MKTSTPYFSIVIPTLNEEKYLPRLLKNLAEQTFTDFEVIHVDGSSDDNTLETAQTFASTLALTTIVIPRKNVATQRNKGANKAVANWIIFMDADNQVPPFFLSKLKQKIEQHPETDLFTCWMKAENPRSPDEKVIASSYNIGLFIAKFINKPTSAGALIGLKKDIILKYPFDESLDVFEDTKLVETLVNHGYVFTIFQTPRYSFSFRRFKKNGLLKQIRFYAECNIYTLLGKDVKLLQKKYPMNGGSDYQDFLENHFNLMYHFEDKIGQISKKQLQFIKDLIDSARSFKL